MRIVAFAYACEPDKGSEPGAGWIWARMLARLGDTTVITRANNRESIEAALPSADGPVPTFAYVDLPTWARFWKKGQRGIRLYYLLWMFAALREAKRLHRQEPFDLSWHLTMAIAWMGSVAWMMGIPSVFGPVGGGARLRRAIFTCFGPVALLRELFRWSLVFVARYLNPLARRACGRATLVIAQNPETLDWLPGDSAGRAIVMPNAVIDASHSHQRKSGLDVRRFVFAGRLVPLKGMHLAIEALALVPDATLTLCGSGPEEDRLRRLSKELAVEDQVRFEGWVTRDRLTEIFRDADAYLAPSFHDQAPGAVAEALSCGLPVVCFDEGGPPVIAGEAAVVVQAVGSRAQVVANLGRAMAGPFPASEVIAQRAGEVGFDERTAELRRLLVTLGFGTDLSVRDVSA